MKKTSIYIDGYNLYHAVHSLQKNYLKWVNLMVLAQEFAQPDNHEIVRCQFFTAFPHHKSINVQQRYSAYVMAVEYYGVQVIEGNFKRKIISYQHNGKSYTRKTHEEKESDVNLSLAILEDAYERISDKIIVITNDSDIAPAIHMARKKNSSLMVNVITPPLIKTKRANYDLLNACGDINKAGKQVFYHTRMIKEVHLAYNLMPETITLNNGELLHMPKEYKREK